jgi:hypothetical protein
MIERYGPEVVAELEALRMSPRKVADDELREILKRVSI